MRHSAHAAAFALAFAVATGWTPAAAQDSNRLAYEASIKCFVANGLARGERLDAGDTATAAIHETNARRSFDLSFRFGHAVGLSDQHINEDLGLAQGAEMPKMVGNAEYFRDTVATCKAIGLM